MQKESILLNIAEDNQAEALFMSKTFVDENIKRRVYINTLGAECVMKYLAANKISVDNTRNIHSITRVIEKADIADILLDNIHIDVRVVFDENIIFIPKTHKKYNICPDIYVVAKIGGASQALELLGYFDSGIIKEENSNDDYYFVSKSELSAPETLCTFIKSAKYSHEKQLSDSQLLRGRELSILTADHDISDVEFKEFMGLLLTSTLLRDSVSEYDNFETLSYDVVPLIINAQEEQNTETEDETAAAAAEEEEEEIDDTEAAEDTEATEESLKPEETEGSITQTQEEETLVLDDIETTLDDFENFENETLENPIVDTSEVASNLTETAAAAGIIGAGAAVAGAISSGAATTEAIELASNATDNIEDIVNTLETKEEPAPEISVEDITLDENLNIEPIEIDNTELPIDMETTEAPVTEIKNENVPPEEIQSDDIFDDFEDFEKLAEPTEASAQNQTDIVNPSEMLTEEEINVTEAPNISEEITDSISPIDDDELFKNSEYDDLFDENSTEEPTYNYVEQNENIEITDKKQPVKNDDNFITEADDNDDFLTDFEEFESAGEEFSATEAITEAEQTVAAMGRGVFENSTIISNKNVQVGEILIDINNMQEDMPMPSEHLENIYNDSPDMKTDAPLKNSVMIGRAQGSKKNKMGVLAGVGALVVLAGVSFAAMKFIKPNADTANSALPPAPQPQTATNENTGEDLNTLNLDNNNVVNMENSTTTPATAQPTQPAKKMASTAFISVRKLSWEVPDYISYNANFKQYFQSAGKSLKSALTSDLLLADEYAYSNEIKVSVLYDKAGTFKEAKILQSSGSSQIDKIVLQSVNQTLNILKAPQSVGNDESTTVILKISI